MAAEIIDGAAIARGIRSEIAQSIRDLGSRSSITPGLVAVLVGNDPASAIYVRNKRLACDEVGIFSTTIELPSSISQIELMEQLIGLNQDDRFHGILVQLPLPSHLDQRLIIETIAPDKDVDSLHPINVGRLADGQSTFLPGTPAGIQQLLLRSGFDPAGQHVVICGRSNIVGKPLAMLLVQKTYGGNATVTVCHTATRGLPEITKGADILVSAVGSPNTITPDMVSSDTVVIDVGINRIPDPSKKRGYRLVGDVDFEGVSEIVKAITPVPGGVGPMTIATLLGNTLKGAEIAAGRMGGIPTT